MFGPGSQDEGCAGIVVGLLIAGFFLWVVFGTAWYIALPAILFMFWVLTL